MSHAKYIWYAEETIGPSLADSLNILEREGWAVFQIQFEGFVDNKDWYRIIVRKLI